MNKPESARPASPFVSLRQLLQSATCGIGTLALAGLLDEQARAFAGELHEHPLGAITLTLAFPPNESIVVL